MTHGTIFTFHTLRGRACGASVHVQQGVSRGCNSLMVVLVFFLGTIAAPAGPGAKENRDSVVERSVDKLWIARFPASF
jgi:hypothetical protein